MKALVVTTTYIVFLLSASHFWELISS